MEKKEAKWTSDEIEFAAISADVVEEANDKLAKNLKKFDGKLSKKFMDESCMAVMAKLPAKAIARTKTAPESAMAVLGGGSFMSLYDWIHMTLVFSVKNPQSLEVLARAAEITDCAAVVVRDMVGQSGETLEHKLTNVKRSDD